MAESTLSYKRVDLKASVGLFLGFGRGADKGDTAWTTKQSALIDDIVASGEHQFYYPPPLQGASGSYDWSFLKPVASLTLPSGANTVRMPDDFGGFEGQVTVSAAAGQSYYPVDLTGVGSVYAQQSRLPSTAGRPQLCCLEPVKGTTMASGQRAQLRVWPLADAEYTLQFQYYVLPDAMTDATPYALGGMAHAETLLESCLAIAEQRLDDASGVHTAKFMERLAASVSLDRRNKPQHLGYNGDRSDGRVPLERERYGLASISYKGVTY
jgi:hypothetical protein